MRRATISALAICTSGALVYLANKDKIEYFTGAIPSAGDYEVEFMKFVA